MRFRNAFLPLLLLMNSTPDHTRQTLHYHHWTGTFPCNKIYLLKPVSADNRLSILRSDKDWNNVWTVFRPGNPVPVINFEQNVVIAVRNVRYFNQVSWKSASRQNHVLSLQTLQTRTARPIGHEASCLFVVVPSDRITAVRCGHDEVTLDAES